MANKNKTKQQKKENEKNVSFRLCYLIMSQRIEAQLFLVFQEVWNFKQLP